MAPTCDWMTEIVKVGNLYLNSLPVSIVYLCVSKRNNEISMRVKTPTCQQEMVTYIAGGKVAFFFSARSISDILAMKKSSAD